MPHPTQSFSIALSADTSTRSLLSSGDYSDLVITCGTDIYNVHKAVVFSQSGFFQGAERFAAGKVSRLDSLFRFTYSEELLTQDALGGIC